MEQSNAEELSIRKLMEDPLLKKYFPKHFNQNIMERQLLDQSLRRFDLDELFQMDEEELATRLFVQGMRLENETSVIPFDLSITNDGGENGSGEQALVSRITVITEGVGVEAKIMLSAPPKGKRGPNEKEIRQALTAAGVIRGIRTDFLIRLVERPIYERKFKIAVGKLPTDGEDGRAVFHFDTTRHLSLSIDPDGHADYQTLDHAQNVKAGDLLCELILPSEGFDGYSIFGEHLSGKPGRASEIVSSSNTYLSEDKQKIFASCDGQVHLKGNKVLVSRVLEVDQVNASTGNVLFVGSVLVRGDVADGCTIRAGGDIIVCGVAHNAVLVSGGNIILCGGLRGKPGSVLESGDSIRSLFIENAKVRARDRIFADSLLDCTVVCGQSVQLAGEKGLLKGGSCTASISIRAHEIGDAAGTATSVCLKENEMSTTRQAQLNLKYNEYQDTVQKLAGIADMAATLDQDELGFQKMLARIVIIRRKLLQEAAKFRKQIIGDESQNGKRTVSVVGTLYPNVSIEIDGETRRNREVRSSCVASKAGDRIVLNLARFE